MPTFAASAPPPALSESLVVSALGPCRNRHPHSPGFTIGNRDGAGARFSAGLSEVNKIRFADSVSCEPVMHLGDPVLL